MKSVLDAYNLRARLMPAMLALLPLLFGLMAWIPTFKSTTEPLTAAAVSAGALFLLVSFVRDLGKKAETRLVQEWGGHLPSILLLRHNDQTLEKETKKRYHAKLQKLIPKLALPSVAEEAADLESADEKYQSCCRFLLCKTRDEKTFPLLKEENINYGFRRNLYGVRPFGLALSVIGVTLCIFKAYRSYAVRQPISEWMLFCLIASSACLASFFFIVNKAYVRSGADAYALRLLESLEQL